MEPDAQGHGNTFTLCHALLKKAILHHTEARGWILFHLSVNCNELVKFKEMKTRFYIIVFKVKFPFKKGVIETGFTVASVLLKYFKQT